MSSDNNKVILEFPLVFDAQELRSILDENNISPKSLDIETDEENREIKKIKSITFKRVNIGKLKKLPPEIFKQNEEELTDPVKIFQCIGVLAELPDAIIDKIDIVDIEKCSDGFKHFLGKSQATGKK